MAVNITKQDKFRKDVRELNDQLQDYIRRELQTNKTANLRRGMAEYNEKLHELEQESGFCVGEVTITISSAILFFR